MFVKKVHDTTSITNAVENTAHKITDLKCPPGGKAPLH